MQHEERIDSQVNRKQQRGPLDASDRRLIELIAPGLPLTPQPYTDIAQQMGCSEQQVIARIEHLQQSGYIKRYGVVVRHHELGYTANGMVVWDMPDDKVSELGRCIGNFDCVTLSYHRPRRLPDWPYNLFTMVHGRNRDEVIKHVEEIVEHCWLQRIEHEILFSTRRFKQRGACYNRLSTQHPDKQKKQTRRRWT
jgi:DNA-binding Lrp family transcriptional regulator